MSTIASLQARLRHIGVNSLVGPIRRLVRWYLAPSGLLLLLASALLVLAFFDWGPSWAFGGAGIVVLTVFLTYRFSRQQGLLLRALQNHQQTTTEQLGGLRTLHTELARTLNGQSELLDTHLANLSSVQHRVDGLNLEVENLHELRHGLARTQSIAAGLDYRLRLIDDGQQDLTTLVTSAVERVDALEAQADEFEAQAVDIGAFGEALSDVQRSVTEIESAIDDTDEGADGPEETDGVTVDAIGALRSDFALWAASTANQSFSGVTVVVSPERSGTTWVFDVLRSLPGASQVATSFVYRKLGIAGNRYPKDLIVDDRSGEPFELRDGVGAFLPKLRQQTFGQADHDLLAVEKLHPSAFDFDPAALLSSLGRLELSLGRVQPVLLIRDPVDTYRSFVSYQESAGWRSDVSTDSVAQFFASSLSTMQRLRRLHDGCLIVSYEDLIADPVTGYTNLADRLGLKTDASAVRHVLDAAEQRRVHAAKSPYFSTAQRRPRASRLVVGEGLPSDREREALESARLIYEELWVDRIS